MVDRLRSCYKTMVRFSDDPAAPLVEIQWYFLDKRGDPLTFPPTLPFYTRFASGNWAGIQDSAAFWKGTGEVSPVPSERRWVNGERLIDRTCSGRPIGTAAQFAGNISWPWVPLPLNACCQPRPLAVFAFAFAADVYQPCVECPSWPRTVFVTTSNDSGCPELNSTWVCNNTLAQPCLYKSPPFSIGGVDYYVFVNPGDPAVFGTSHNIGVNRASDDATALWYQDAPGGGFQVDCLLPATNLLSQDDGLLPCSPPPTSMSVNGSLHPLDHLIHWEYIFRWDVLAVPVPKSSLKWKFAFNVDVASPPAGAPCPSMAFSPAAIIVRSTGWTNTGCSDCDNMNQDFLIPQTAPCVYDATFPVVLCGAVVNVNIHLVAGGGPDEIDLSFFSGGGSPAIFANYSVSLTAPYSLPQVLTNTLGGGAACNQPTTIAVLIAP